MLHRVIKIQMLKVSYIKIYKCKNRYREREPRGGWGGRALRPLPGELLLPFLFLCFFYKKKPQNQNKIPASRWLPELPGVEKLGDGDGAAASVPLQRLSRGILAPPQPLPLVLALLELLRDTGSRKRLGGCPEWEALGVGRGGRSPRALGGKNARFPCGNGPGQVGFVEWGDPGGPPLCTSPEIKGGGCLDPKMGAGKFLASSIPSPSSAPPPPPRTHSRGRSRGPDPAQLTPKLLPGNNPRFPLWGIHTPHPQPRFGMEPGQGSRDVSGAGRGGCGRKNGKDRALPRREEQDPGKPCVGFFSSKLSLFPPFFFSQEPPPAVPQQNPRVSLVSLRCFPLLQTG